MPDAIGNGCEIVADTPAKHTDPQAAMKRHLSQSTGAGAFDGQHGMSSAISSIVADADMSDDVIFDGVISGGVISSVIAGIGACEDVAAMTGRETGANARPAIIKTASSRRMARWRFTSSVSHKIAAKKSSLNTIDFCSAGLDRCQNRLRAWGRKIFVRRPDGQV